MSAICSEPMSRDLSAALAAPGVTTATGSADEEGFTKFSKNRRTRRLQGSSRREHQAVVPTPERLSTPVKSAVHVLPVSPPLSASPTPLMQLHDMFEHLPKIVVQKAYYDCDCRMDATIEYLLVLSQSHVETKGNAKETSNKTDFLTALPEDALFHVLECLDTFDLCRLSSTNRLCRQQVLRTFEKVEQFNLTRYRFWPDYVLLRMLARFPKLNKVSLSKCKEFTRFEDLPAVAPHLTSLDLAACDQLSDDGLSHIAQWMPKLQTIDLSGSYISDEGLEVVASSLDELTALTLDSCKRPSEKAYHNIFNRMPGLRYLSLQGTRVNCASIIFPRANRLETLNLSRCKRLSNLSITSRFCTLKTLNLSSNIGLFSCIIHIPTLESLNLSLSTQLRRLELRTPRLRTLNASGCVLLQQMTAEGETKLESVNLCGCRTMTNTSFVSLLDSCIQTLDNIMCDGMITLIDESLNLFFSERGAKLRTVVLKGCRGLSHHVQAQLKAHLERSEQQRQQARERERRLKMSQGRALLEATAAVSSLRLSPGIASLVSDATALDADL